MEILGIQIASITFSIAMIYMTYLCYRRKYFEIYATLIWIIIFLAVILFTLFPNLLIPFAEILKVARLFDMFIIAGIFFLITITFVNFIYTHKLKAKIHRLVQEKAMEEDKEND